MFFTQQSPRPVGSLYEEPDTTQPGASVSEAFKTSFDEYTRTQSTFQQWGNVNDAYDAHNRKVQEITGETLWNPMRSNIDYTQSERFYADWKRYKDEGGQIGHGDFKSQWLEKEYLKRLEELAAKHPDRRADLIPETGFTSQGRRLFSEAEEAAKRLQPDNSISAWLGWLGGQAAGMATDPAVVLTAPAGFSHRTAPGVVGILEGMGKAAGANMALEAGLQVPVQVQRREQGGSSGFGEGALNVLGAGAFGAGADLAVRGTARILRQGFGYEPIVVDGQVTGYKKKGADGKEITISSETVARADQGDPAAVREIVQKEGRELDRFQRTELDAIDADTILAGKPDKLIDDADHQVATVQAVRHVTDPDLEPVPAVHADASLAKLRDMDADLAELRAERDRLVTRERTADEMVTPAARTEGETKALKDADAAKAETAKVRAELEERIGQLEAARDAGRRAVMSEEMIALEDSGRYHPAYVDAVKTYVANKAVQAQVLEELQKRGPASADEIRHTVADILQSPDYRAPVAEVGPEPVGVVNRRLDDPYGKEAQAQVAALEAKLAEELSGGKPVAPRAREMTPDPIERQANVVKAVDEAVTEAKAEMPPAYRDPESGAPMSEGDIATLVEMWRYVRQEKPKKPESLTGFIMRTGRLQDQNGELTNILGGKNRQLISGKGSTLDDAALRAYEAGFFPERPSIAEFLDAIDRDAKGDLVVKLQDMAALDDWRVAQDMEVELDRLGIGKARSEDDIRGHFQGARDAGAGESRGRADTGRTPSEDELAPPFRFGEAPAIDRAVAEARQMLPGNVAVRTFASADDLSPRMSADVREAEARTGQRISGFYEPDTAAVWLSIAATDPRGIAIHEATHALERMGLLTRQEMDLLVARAEKIDDLFPEGRDLYRDNYREWVKAGRMTEEQFTAYMRSEEIAHLIEARAVGRDFGREVNGILDRILRFFERLRNKLSGYGFQTADDVIEAVLSGEVAKRQAIRQVMAQEDVTAFAIRPKNTIPPADGPDVFDWNPATTAGSRETKVGNTTITYGIDPRRNYAQIILVETPRGNRGEGSARAALERFLGEADRHGRIVTLTAEPMDKGVSKGRLEKFYRSLGFVPNKGKNVDHTVRAGMIRQPQQGGDSGLMFAFAGERAKTADLQKLAQAKEMEAAGKDRTAIWDQTGWFKGVDGKWRFEISDDKMSVSGDKGRLADILNHPELLRAYPDLGNIQATKGGVGGAYSATPDGLIDRLRGIRERIEFGSEPSLMHEIQHALQGREELATGGNPAKTGAATYERLAGEVEARAAQKRIWYTPEERAEIPPWTDYDVPEKDQIVRLPSGEGPMFAMRGEAETPQRMDLDAMTGQLAEMAEPLRTALRGLNRGGKDAPSLDLSMGPQGLIAQLTEQADPGSFKILRDDDGLISGVEVRGQTYEVARDDNGAITGLMTSAERAVMEQQEAISQTAADLIARNTGLAPDRAKAIADEAIGIVRENLTDLDGMRTGLAGLVQRTIDEVQNPSAALMFAMRDERGRLKPGAEMRVQALQADLAEIENKLQTAMWSEVEALQAKRGALINALKLENAIDDITNFRDAKGRIDPSKGFMSLFESTGAGTGTDLQHLHKAIEDKYREKIWRMLWEVRRGAVTGDKRRNQGHLATLMDDTIREAAGENTRNPMARQFAQDWLAVAEELRQEFNAEGGAIPKLDGWYGPQYHDPEALLKAGSQAWVDFVFESLDRAKMIDYRTGKPMGDAELRSMLRETWRKTTSAERSILNEPTGTPEGLGAVYKRHQEHRVLHFKNADAYLAYNKVYGGGDVYAGMLGHIAVMTREIAMMRRFGANPDLTVRRLTEFVKNATGPTRTLPYLLQGVSDTVADFTRLVPRSEKVAATFSELDKAVRDLDNLYAQDRDRITKRHTEAIQTGETRVWDLARAIDNQITDLTRNAQDNILAEKVRKTLDELTALQGYAVDRTRNWVTTDNYMVGRAIDIYDLFKGTTNIPSSERLANISAAARSWVGASTLAFAPFSSIADHANQLAARKFIGMPATTQLQTWLKSFSAADRQAAMQAGFVFDNALGAFAEKANGLNDTHARSFMAYLADRTHALSFLSPMTTAQKVAFSQEFAAWMATLANTPLNRLDDRVQRMFQRHNITANDWDLIRSSAPDTRFHGIPMLTREAVTSAVGEDLAEKYMMMLLRERSHAVLEGTLQGRTFWLQRTQAGTTTGEFMRSVAMLKSFPTTYTLLVLGRLYDEILAGRGLTMSTAGYGTAVFVVGTFLGAVAMQMKSIGKGKDPEDMTNPKFWGRAFLQSGGIGIAGDFIAASENRFGGGVGSTFLGPIFSNLLDPAAGLIGGNALQLARGDKTNAGRELTEALRKNTPVLPWYLRQGYERVVLDWLQQKTDPEAYRSFRQKEQKAKKERNQDFYWPPGQPLPNRAPNMGAITGR